MKLRELENKIAVNCRNMDEVNRILALIREVGFKMMFPDIYYYNKHLNGVCFSLTSGFCYESVAFYKRIGFEVVDSSEIKN